MTGHLTTLLSAVLLLVACVALASEALTPPDARSLAADVAALTALEMEGRASGTPGGDRAGRRIAGWLADAGLEPGGDEGTFFQAFAMWTGRVLASGNDLELETPLGPRFDVDRDWRPYGGSLPREVSGEIVFVGHGVVTPDGRHDDYAGLDVAGKIAVALDGAPAGLAAPASTRLEKLIAARRRGAQALLIVADRLPPLAATSASVGIVAATITPRVGKALLGRRDLRAAAPGPIAGDGGAASAIDRPRRVRIRVAFRREERRAANVIGVLAGRDPELSREAVVIGAHYDHLGMRDGVVFPGADDNASGTAVVVELARAFRAAGGLPRTLVFALFAGEELGLLGSGHYVQAPPVPLDRTVAMINLDMVGRMRDDRLTVGGADSGSRLRPVVTEAARRAGVALDLTGDPSGPSDHTRFYRSGTPVLFFHTGGHADYHRSSDTEDKINADGMARTAAVALGVVGELARGPRITYTAVVSSRGRPSGGGGGAFLGIVADPHGGDGVRLADVVPGGAAARAGVREGDVLVRCAGRSLTGFEDLRDVLKNHRPGDAIEVVYLRDGQDRLTTATLDVRP